MIRFEIQEGNPQVIRYLVVLNNDTDYLVQSDVSSMKLYVYETEANTQKTPNGGETLVVADCIYNTLQSWDKDDVGYNVRIPVSGSYSADGNRTYRIEVKITPVTGEAFYLEHVELPATETFST